MYLGSDWQDAGVFGEVGYHVVIALAQEYACCSAVYQIGNCVVFIAEKDIVRLKAGVKANMIDKRGEWVILACGDIAQAAELLHSDTVLPGEGTVRAGQQHKAAVVADGIIFQVGKAPAVKEQAGVYAAGDITGQGMLAHTASEGGIVAVENMAGLDREDWRGRFRLLPYRAVGVEHSMLLALRVDGARVGGRDWGPSLVALSPGPVSDGGRYSALVGAE